VSLRDLYAQCSDRVQFLLIYIREAHPTDGWYMGTHDIQDPTTMEARRHVAGTCETAMRHGIQTYVDELDDAVMKAYAAWPDRLYLVGLDGHVVWAGGKGPFGFRPARLKKAIKHLLARPDRGEASAAG